MTVLASPPTITDLPALPSGTVSFVFTDIEGSTRMWERYPDLMRPALRRHDDLMRAAIEGNNGVVFRTVGDAFCCAFAQPIDALKAVVQAQEFLQTEAWTRETPIRVRMAIHVGAIEIDRGDYVGACLNRLARLLAIAHGEQTVISQAAYELLRDQLPGGINLLALGAHRLKDLSRSENVYQVTKPGLRDVFPPLRSLGSPDLPNNLPEQFTSFVGRVKEVRDMERLLISTRLLTLVGPGGVGKTRLSLQVGASVLDRYPHGVFVAELAPIDASASVAATVARALGIRDIGSADVETAVRKFLAEKHMLLLLDNTEHVIADAARFIDSILQTCPHLSLLVTSREPLNVPGEQIYRLSPLSLPPDSGETVTALSPTPAFLSQFEAVRLFIERALTHRPDFAITKENAPFVAQICHRLDGIPLAIELATARLRSLSVEEVAKRLSERFRLLTGGSRTALPRQQTLRALMDWSHELLPDSERVLLRRFSVFAGGATIAAAEQVCADELLDEFDILDSLQALAEKSLLVPDENGETLRYRMLETVKEYGFQKLQDAGEVNVVRHQFVEWCMAFCHESDALYSPAKQSKWLERIGAEYANLSVAMESGGLPLLTACASIWRFWQLRGLLREGRAWCEKALQIPTDAVSDGESLRARVLLGAGWMAQMQGDAPTAKNWLEEARQICRDADDQEGLSNTLNILGLVAFIQQDYVQAKELHEAARSISHARGNLCGIASPTQCLGNVAFMQGDFAEAERCYTESLALMREIGDQRGETNALSNLAIVISGRGDYVQTDILMRQCLELRRKIGDPTGVATSLHNLGMVNRYLRNWSDAESYLQEAVTLRQRMGDRRGVSRSIHNLGVIALAQGDMVRARDLLRESLRIKQQMESLLDMVETVESWATLLAMEQDAISAARYWGLAHAQRQQLNSQLRPEEQILQDEAIADARHLTTPEAWDAAWTEGEVMTMETAVNTILVGGTTH